MKNLIRGIFITLILASTTIVYAEGTSKTPTAVTTSNPDVSTEDLHLMVRHMTSDELFVEADAWLVLLKEKAKKVYDTKLIVQEKNAQIDVLSSKDNNQTEAEERKDIQEKITLEKEEKSVVLEELTKARASRKDMVSRLNSVLENINDKIGTDINGKELEKVLPYRRYIDTVSGISLEVTDVHSAWTTINAWIVSEEGGISRQDYPAIRRWTDRVKRIPGFVVMSGVFPAGPQLQLQNKLEAS